MWCIQLNYSYFDDCPINKLCPLNAFFAKPQMYCKRQHVLNVIGPLLDEDTGVSNCTGLIADVIFTWLPCIVEMKYI